jgi:hypothetical protein
MFRYVRKALISIAPASLAFVSSCPALASEAPAAEMREMS